MKCPNCGNEILGDSNHCSSCGKQVNNIPSNIDIINRSKNKIDAFENKVNSQNKNTSFRKFFLRMLFVIIIFISLYNFILIISQNYISADFRKEFINIGEDKIPSAYPMFGKVKICGVSFNEGYQTGMSFKFCDSEVSQEMLDDYLDFLIEEGYEVIESEYSRSVYKYANDENFILVVSVDYTDSFLNYERRVSDEFLEQSVSA